MDARHLSVLLCAFLGSYRLEARGGDGPIVGHHHGNSLLHHQPQHQDPPQPQHQQKQKQGHPSDGDNPGEDAVAAFLHTGDARTLALANCSRRFELASSRGSTESMSRVLDTLIHATNFLNMILQTNRSREQSLSSDMEWYQALVRSILEGDERIHRAVLSFSVDSVKPDVLLQATRSGGHTLLQDLSETPLHQRGPESEWYHDLKRRKKPLFHKRMLSQDSEQRETLIPDRSHVLWSSPYLECERGKLLPRWLLTLSAAIYGKNDQAPEFRGLLRLDINLQDVDIDQCSSHGWFSGTHQCNSTTMECLPIPGYGFVLDKYQCQCKKGFYHPNRVAVNSFTRPGKSGRVSESVLDADEGWSSDCLPCAAGCAFCRDDTQCVPREDGALRLAVVSFQSLFMLLLFISMILIYHYRRNKSIRASGLVLLEAILCGAVLLYFPVGILFFQPSVFRCILLRWVRLLGFATVYGTLTLKLYRVLKVFLSRTAQRIPYMTSWRVLRLLVLILVVVVWFLVSWTSAVCQSEQQREALITEGLSSEGLHFSMCLLNPWDYMMAVGESLFLVWAVYLCYAVRTVPSAFHEPRFMAIAVHNELLLSAIFHIIRFSVSHQLHPDWMLLLFFTHTHLTVTVTLGLMLIPKFLFAATPREDMASEAYEDELDLGRSGSYLNSSITSAWSEHSLDPEDIREELKKLYSQLEIYKRKKMLANNPHLQKKRSSKKGLGRSLMRRITEIPESVHRQCSREDKDFGEHGSNRNSICMLKKNPFDPLHAVKPVKDETIIKNSVFSLKKSYSSYDHIRDQSEDSNTADKMEVATAEGSLLETLMGKKIVQRKSDDNVNAPSESAESVPLVCKSASAHNLTADKKPIHPKASMLQKSLSVIASAKERTLGLTGKMQSSEDSSRKTQPKSKESKGSVASDTETKLVIQTVEAKPTVTKSCMAKPQVSSSQPVMCPDPVKSKEFYDLSEVCPWEVEDIHTSSENKVQKHVSIAPNETTTVHGGPSRGKTQPQRKKGSDVYVGGAKETPRTSAMRADICPWEETSVDSGLLTKPPGQTPGPKARSPLLPESKQADVCPWDFDNDQKTSEPVGSAETWMKVKDSTVTERAGVCPWDFDSDRKTSEQLISKDTTKIEKESSTTQRADICPWDFDEAQKTEPVHSMDSVKKGTSPVEPRGKSALCEPPKQAVSLQLPTAKADVCPWDYDSTALPPHSQQTPSPSPSRKIGCLTPRTIEASKEDDKSRLKSQDKLKSTDMPPRSQKMAEVCPWELESEEPPLVEKRRSTNLGAAKTKAEVCPWEFEEATPASCGVRQTSPSGKIQADVCPWVFDDSTAKKA